MLDQRKAKDVKEKVQGKSQDQAKPPEEAFRELNLEESLELAKAKHRWKDIPERGDVICEKSGDIKEDTKTLEELAGMA